MYNEITMSVFSVSESDNEASQVEVSYTAPAPTTSSSHGMSQDVRVLVRGYDDMSRDIMELFLENRKRCGGGPVSDITMDAETDVATVTFEDSDGITATNIERNIDHILLYALELSVSNN